MLIVTLQKLCNSCIEQCYTLQNERAVKEFIFSLCYQRKMFLHALACLLVQKVQALIFLWMFYTLSGKLCRFSMGIHTHGACCNSTAYKQTGHAQQKAHLPWECGMNLTWKAVLVCAVKISNMAKRASVSQLHIGNESLS